MMNSRSIIRNVLTLLGVFFLVGGAHAQVARASVILGEEIELKFDVLFPDQTQSFVFPGEFGFEYEISIDGGDFQFTYGTPRAFVRSQGGAFSISGDLGASGTSRPYSGTLTLASFEIELLGGLIEPSLSGADQALASISNFVGNGEILLSLDLNADGESATGGVDLAVSSARLDLVLPSDSFPGIGGDPIRFPRGFAPGTTIVDAEVDFDLSTETPSSIDLSLGGEMFSFSTASDIQFVGSSLNVIPEPSASLLILPALAFCFLRRSRGL